MGDFGTIWIKISEAHSASQHEDPFKKRNQNEHAEISQRITEVAVLCRLILDINVTFLFILRDHLWDLVSRYESHSVSSM